MAYDSTKPTASGALVSADVRANFEGLRSAVGGVNLIKDSTFLIWAAGDAAAPTHWALSGAGSACARETSIIKVGPHSAKLTAGGGAEGFLIQYLLPTATYLDFLDGQKVSLGAWVYATVASKVRLYISDGAATTYSSYHTGGSSWEWLTVTHTIDVAATFVVSGLRALASAVGYISGPTMLLGEAPPTRFHPSPCVYVTESLFLPGNQTTGTAKGGVGIPRRPALVKYVQLSVATGPASQALIVDVNTYSIGGGAYMSMFSTRPEIAAAAATGGAAPDGTYARRCLSTFVGVTAYPDSNGAGWTIDIDQVGTGTPGADLRVDMRMLQFTSPFEAFLGVTEIS